MEGDGDAGSVNVSVDVETPCSGRFSFFRELGGTKFLQDFPPGG